MRLLALTAVLSSVLFSAIGTFAAEPVAVKVTVTEPAGVARTGELASGGIPFLPGQVKDVSSLALTDEAGKPVPAQFSRMTGYEDGSVQWALLDVLVDVPAGGSAAFVVKSGKPAAAGDPLAITETAGQVTVKTAGQTFVVSKTDFNLLGDGELTVVDGEGKAFTARKPTRVSWEYRGPVRATLRVEGPYVADDGSEYLTHCTRLTFVAGSKMVVVDHSLRNSDPKAGFDAAIKQAALTGGGVLALQQRGGCYPANWPSDKSKLIGDGEALVVPPLSIEAAPRGTLYGYDTAKGVYMLADRAHKDTRVWVGPGGKASAEQTRALTGTLHALADPQWISRTQALGMGHFGTLQDEIDTYRKWGWKGWDQEKKYPRSRPNPDLHIAKVSVHDVSETDSVEGYVLMYARTGQPGFLDLARAWADQYRTYYAYRTDGYDFGAKRPSKGLKVGWYGPRQYGWSDSRSEYCHFYGRGIFDYYCLTGEVDALEAGRDLVEQVDAWSAKYKPGSSVGYYGCRGFARLWLGAIRLGQLTRDPADRKVADRMYEAAIKAGDWDDRGFYFWGAGPTYLAGNWLKPSKWPARLTEEFNAKGYKFSDKGIVTAPDGSTHPVRSDGGTWQQTTFQMAFERYYRLSGQEEAKRHAVRMAEFTRDYQFSKKCEQLYYYTIVDFPAKGQVYDPAVYSDEHNNCPGPGAKHSGWYTRFAIGVFARAYSLTGDESWLEWGKKAYDRGTKRGYQQTKQSAAEDEVYLFASHDAPKDDSVVASSRLFYVVTHDK